MSQSSSGARPRASMSAAMVLSLAAWPVFAQPTNDSEQLAQLVNEYRESGPSCNGEDRVDAAPLSPNENLAQVNLEPGASWQQALGDAGYQAAQIQALQVSGPTDPESAMDALRSGYCDLLLDGRYADIGVKRDGRTWQVVLAQPLVSDDMGDWRAEGKAVLEAVNEARRSARQCGDRSFDAAPPLDWSDALGKAALAHSRDMAERGYFSHSSPEGQQVSDRAAEQGYRFRQVGENIGFGQSTPEQVVEGWLLSPGHCANIMQADYTEMGAAYALKRADNTIMWTQVLGRPR